MRDPIQTAILRASVLTANEKAQLLDPLKDCFDRLRAGTLSNHCFTFLADSMNLAEALTQPGVGLLPDHMQKFDAAQEALIALAARRQAGGSWTCHAHEIAAIDTAIEYHAIQLDYASGSDMEKAALNVSRKIRGAKSGSPGRNHTHTNLPMEAA